MLWHGYYDCQTKNGVKYLEVSEMFLRRMCGLLQIFFPSPVSSEYFRVEET